MVSKQLTQLDIAFADVIFEGSLKGVELVRRDQSEDGPSFFKFTFDVDEVVRGEFHQAEIVVGWTTAHYNDTWELSFEDFKASFGERTRVAISTPELSGVFCEARPITQNVYDEGKKSVVSGYLRQPVCGVAVDSIELAARVNIPFVLSNDNVCGSSYIFPAQMYEDMRNFQENYQAYQEVRAVDRIKRVRGRDYSELYQEMVPESSLPWEYDAPTASVLAINLVRAHPWFFIPPLRTNTTHQEVLLDLGIAMGKYKSGLRAAWFDRDEDELMKFREDLKEEMLRLVDYIEKDSNFRTRLLLED